MDGNVETHGNGLSYTIGLIKVSLTNKLFINDSMSSFGSSSGATSVVRTAIGFLVCVLRNIRISTQKNQ